MFVCNNLCIGNVVYATEKFQGDGTKSSPYLIQDINDMNKLAMNVNSGNNYEGVYFLLTNDLIYDNTSNNYTPIGKNGSVFEGNFDGNYKIIKGINVSSGSQIGIFGMTGGNANIHNVVLFDSDINGTTSVGGIVGYNQGNVQNCFNGANISGSNEIGGIVGASFGENSKIYNCSNHGVITYTWSGGGGILGYGNTNVSYCYNAGSVSGPKNLGGIIGEGEYIYNCYNVSDIKPGFRSGSLIGASGYGSGAINNSYYLYGSCNCAVYQSTMSELSKKIDEIKSFHFVDNINNGSNCFVYDTTGVNQGYPIANWEYDILCRFNKMADIDIDNYIIEEVRKYTTSQEYAQFDAIVKSHASNEEKFRRLNELFHNNGITDIHEGIQYLSEATPYRYNYLFLTSNDAYCAYNWSEWLNTTTKGNIARGLLWADGLIFNYEAMSYLNLSTYTENDYPGVKKNKTLLKKIMENDGNNLISDIYNNSNKVSKYLKNILKLNNITATDEIDNLMDQIINCTSESECKNLQIQFADKILYQLKINGSDKVYLDGEQFSKALGYSASIISFAGATTEDIVDLINLNTDIEIYKKHEKFLTTIYNNTDISFEMRLAAYMLLDEINNGYYNKVVAILGDIIDGGIDIMYIDKSLLQTYLESKGVGNIGALVGEAVGTINLAAFISNIVIDAGDFVKQAAYTQGYAELSALYSSKLEEDKQKFLAEESAENAWNFFEDYTILWNLRYQGEKQYIDMNSIKMFLFGSVRSFDYNLKLAVVNDTLDRLENCRFRISQNYTVPQSVQYTKKAVIDCPVDVNVYTESGELVASLKDGVESDIVNKYGRFAVVCQSYSGEYAKVICQSTNDDLIYELNAVSDGLVDYKASDGEIIQRFDKVEVAENDVINISDDTYKIDIDSDGNADINGSLLENNINDYIKINAAYLNMDSLSIYQGNTKTIGITLSPENATNTAVEWFSLNDNIATVKNGVVTGISPGETTIVAKVLDSNEITLNLPVTVNQVKGTCGENADWVISGSALIINGVGAMKDYDSDRELWYEFKHIFDEVKVNEGITYIGSNSFDNCDNIENIRLPNSLKEIGTNAFNNCKGLKCINIPPYVDKIADYAFKDCDKNILILYVEKNSYAEQYAIENDIIFKIIGDINSDSIVDEADASAILKYTSGITNEIDLKSADVNNDDNVDLIDVLLVLDVDKGV